MSLSPARLSWAAIFLAVFIWSAIRPTDYPIWGLEVAPAVIGAGVLWATRSVFPLTTLVYVLILIHCVILMIGGHYTYAEVPAFDWIRDAVGGTRNNYDKVGHFAQGFVPAMIAREIAIRKNIFRDVWWRNFFVVCFCLAFSALFEMFEWWVAVLSEATADGYLATQGYVWDTQSDMWWALVGATLALLLLGSRHDKEMAERGYVANTGP